MQLFSTFENSLFLEMAISTLEKRGIHKESILAVPLDNRKESRMLFDNLHRSDGTSLIDIGMGLATAFSVIGVSIGFQLNWGPIVWGLISAFVGFALGVAIKLYKESPDKKQKNNRKGKKTEVILIVNCEKQQSEIVENILWEHFAIGVAKIIVPEGEEE